MLHPEKTGEGPLCPTTRLSRPQRALYLPPGQPGAAMMALGASSLLQTLAAAAWCLQRLPGLRLTLHPRWCCGRASARFLNPLARAPAPAPEIICLACACPLHRWGSAQAPPKVAETLAWGTVKPKPPVERAEALLALLNAEGGEGWQDAERGLVTAQVYEDLVAVWRALGLASREGRLTKADENRVLRACGLVTTVTPPAQPPKRQNEQQWQGKGKGRHQNQRPPQRAPLRPSPSARAAARYGCSRGPTDRSCASTSACTWTGRGAATGSLSDEQMASLSFASMGVVFNCGPSPDTPSGGLVAPRGRV